MKVLNLYSCLGGNRKLWSNEHDITSVELDPFIADIYKEMYPNDKIIVGDAHEYLLNNYQDYDFIWSSPPCPTHSRARFARHKSTKSEYPDMKLYQEIILLHHYFKGIFCVENVVPFYKVLIPGQKRGRHVFWSSFKLPAILSDRVSNFMESENEVKKWEEFHDIDLSKYKGTQRKDKIARNLVDYEAGKTIFDKAVKVYQSNNQSQGVLNFEL